MPDLNNNIFIYYCPSYKTWDVQCKTLNLGQNVFKIKNINETETVYLDKIKNLDIFRIIPLTNLLEETARADISILYYRAKLEAQSFTSLMADLCQDISRVSLPIRCLNGTFP